MLIASHDTVLRVPKPGNVSEIMEIVVRAEGDHLYVASYKLSMEHMSSLGQVLNTSRWDRVDTQWVSMHGHHVIWDRPLSNDSQFTLDADTQKYVSTKSFAMQIRLDCKGQTPCIADGDMVKTVIEIGTASSSIYEHARVSIKTEVSSLLSCVHTRATARIEGLEPDSDSVPMSTRIRLRVLANDIDNLPVNFTRVAINLVLGGGQIIPMQWRRGSNEYVVDVPADITQQPGLFDLVLNASNAWNETSGQVASCELLRRTITVQEDRSTTWVLVGGGTSAVFVVGASAAAAVLVHKKYAHLQAIMVMLFTEVSPLRQSRWPLDFNVVRTS
jgi:hypothetical protein